MEENPYIHCNTDKCVECHACEVSCKATHGIEPGVKWRWVESVWKGEYPDVTNYSISIGCYHCEDAPCIDACPSGAIRMNENGVVLVDRETCRGSRECVPACPYDIPRFGSDGKMQKCDLCIDITEPGKLPVCVKTCPSGALTLNR